MSRQVTWDDIDKDNPDPDDVRYLLDREMIPMEKRQAALEWLREQEAADDETEVVATETGAAGGSGESAEPLPNFEEMTKEQLLAYAGENNIEGVKPSMKHDEMVEAVKAGSTKTAQG